MLPKINRLNLKKEELRQVFNYKIKSTPNCDYFACKNQEKIFRAAVVVPIKIVKKAVQRNTIKRKLFDIIQQNSITKHNLDLIIMFKKEVERSSQIDWQQLRLEVDKALAEIDTKLLVLT